MTSKNNEMHSIKVTFNGETRRLQLSEGVDGRLYYNVLVESIKSVFPSLTAIQLQYEDDEGDYISLSTDRELEEAVRVMYTLNNNKILKFRITDVSSSVPATTTTAAETTNTATAPTTIPKTKTTTTPTATATTEIRHCNVTCDGCGMFPIVGNRFKSAVIENYDLCETCEAKGTHSHPMLKITDPSQAPSMLIYEYTESNRERPRHHHPHHQKRWMPFWGQQGPPPPPPQFPNGVPPPRPFHGPGPQGPRRFCRMPPPGERWRHSNNNSNENVYVNVAAGAGKTFVSPFVAAMDANNNNNNNTDKEGPFSSSCCGEKEIEEESPNLSSFASALSQKISDAALSIVNANLFDNNNSNNNIKPALRFVRHVTYPDGTLVQPGGIFNKTWRVRNDGSQPWPEGVSLAYTSGDVLSDLPNETRYPVTETVPSGEEIEITIQLKAPECTGRFVSYFRMQTKEDSKFGQRLWADVIVSDDETDWHVVRLSKCDEILRETAESLLEIEKSENCSEKSDTEDIPLPTATVVSDNNNIADKLIVTDNNNDNVTITVDSANTIVSEATNEFVTNELPVSEKWQKELLLLGEMGFADREILIPLLEENLENNNQSNTEGMQRVVATLLSESGFLH